MKRLLGGIILAITFTLIFATSSFAQTFRQGEMVKVKGDSTAQTWVVERYSNNHMGYVLKDTFGHQEWFPTNDIMPLSALDTTMTPDSSFGESGFDVNGPFAVTKVMSNGMKPIKIETISPHSGLLILGIGQLAGSIFEFILAGNTNDNTVKTAGYVAGAFLLASGIGVLSFSLERETWATYANGIQIKLSITP